MKEGKRVSSFVVSLLLHLAILLPLLFVSLGQPVIQELMAIESIVDKKKPDPIDIVKKLDTQKEAATTMNTVAGATSSKVGGSSKKVVTTQRVQVESKLKTEIAFTPGQIPTPGTDEIAVDLGEGEVLGSPQVLVKGYGPALDRLTQELIRMMRTDKLMVVWLFDESGSMKDDQQDIKSRFGRVMKELQIVDREAEKIGISKKFRRKKGKSLLKEIMLTSIASYGAAYHPQTASPTADLSTIMAAIDKIPIDKSGTENTCMALMEAINRHRGVTRSRLAKRKLVLIVISDESGDDGMGIEPVIQQAKVLKAPIYVLGRESCFGSLYAHVTWRQPETGHVYYLPIRRGPETPFAELLQHDGFRRRRDSHMSGFGPYDQVRMCRETGGIFFQLPHEQANLNDYEEHVYKALRLKEYLPDLTSRTRYQLYRDRSKFRKAIWDVIVLLNPYNKQNKGIELPDPRYQRFSTNPAQFGPVVAKRGKQILAMIALYGRAIQHLESVRELRNREPSQRWRAHYDLITAQCYWYQLRLFEYGIGLDQFVRKGMKKDPKHNRWSVAESSRNLILPDEQQQRLFKVTPSQLKAHYENALARLDEVAELHPETPWADRARWEMKRPFGVVFRTWYQPPPKPSKRRPRPKPTPPPKL